MLSGPASILMVYVEPTPYILGLIQELKRSSAASLQVWFLTENVSQDWKLDLPDCCRIVDEGPVKLVQRFVRFSRDRRLKLIHLAGWGGDARLSILIAVSWLLRISIFIESDTQAPFEEASWKRAMKRLLYPVLFLVPTTFLPGGTRQAQYLMSFGVNDERIRVVQMTADVAAIMSFSDRFDAQLRRVWRESLGLRPAETIFLFVGRLVDRQKGVSQLLAAFERLVQTEPYVRLVIAGDGPMRPAVEQLAATAKWLVYLGRLDGERLLCAYCGADALVLPSRFESWGLVVNEAMAAGLPVIISNRVGCANDLVDGHETGIMYDYAHIDGLFDALVAMTRNAGARQEMSTTARALISSWTLQAEAERIRVAWNGAE